jgi:predicted DNA-binding transcriptional regulator AlpA
MNMRKTELKGADGEPHLRQERVTWTVEMLARLGCSLNENVSILIGLEVLMLLTSLSKAYLYQLMDEDPSFPAKVKIGSRTCWSFWATQQWIREQIERAKPAAR